MDKSGWFEEEKKIGSWSVSYTTRESKIFY